MKPYLLILALAACSDPFGIKSTIVRDGSFDAPWGCPAQRQALTFSRTLHEALDQNARGYQVSIATGRAIAMCYDPTSSHICEGPRDAPLVPAGVDPESSSIDFNLPQLTPEGDHMYVGSFDLDTVTGALRDYQRVGDTWVRQPDLPFAQNGFISTPSSAPERHVLFNPGQNHLEEWALVSGTWQLVRMPTYAELGIATVETMWLSPDALHLIVRAELTSNPTVHVIATSERPSPADPFPALTLREDIINGQDPFVTADCLRLYVTGLDAVFYVTP